MKLGFVVALLLWLSLVSCSIPRPTDVTVAADPQDNAQGNPQPGSQKSDFFVFVGEKLEVVPVNPPDGESWFDSAFDAKYRVIEPVVGEFAGDVIEFRVFDHYGYPPFANYTHALLFISKHEGKLYHEKYQYHAVYKTIDGRWAGCGDPYLGMDYHRKPFTPKPLEFAEPVEFNLGKFSKEQRKRIFAEPYFEIEGEQAVCKMGAYVDELYQINRDGVLKARGVGQ